MFSGDLTEPRMPSGQILQEMKAWINKIDEREFGSLFCRPSGCWQLDFSGKNLVLLFWIYCTVIAQYT